MFRRAVIRLTVAYTLIQLVVYGAFALGVYAFVTAAFDFDAIATESEEAVAADAAEHGFETLRNGLLIIYGCLAVLVPFVSYVMARSALRPLEAGYEAQQRFVDDASHEFRTPLSVIQAELELALSAERRPEEYALALRTSLDEVQQLIALTDGLLLLARGSRPEMLATFREVSLADIATTAADRGNAGAAATRTTVSVVRDARVLGSRELLTRAAENVLDNARRFTPASGTITISVDRVANSGILRIQDTGMGMDADAVRHAFDRFWRADATRTETGHGLGLAIVRQICMAHGGEASISSAPGAGTTLTLSLPAR